MVYRGVGHRRDRRAMTAYILTAGGFLILSGQFLYEAFQTHSLLKKNQPANQAVAIYLLGGIMLMAGLIVSQL
jgi:hypothetical protein